MTRLLLLVLIVLATALRAYHLDWHSLWDDEGFTASMLGQGLSEMWANTPLGNLPLYYYMVRLWTAGSGTTEFALRYLSLWFGVLLVPFTYLIGGRLFGPSARLPAALMMTIAPPFIYHSQSARPYTLLTVLYVANLLLVLRLLERPGDRRLWLGLTATAALASYTHFYGMLLPVLAALVLLPHVRRDRRFLVGLGGATAGTILLLVPWLLTHLGGNSSYVRGYLTSAPEAVVALIRAEQVWVGLLAQTGYGIQVEAAHKWTLLPLVALVGGLAVLWRRQNRPIRFAVLVYLAVPVGGGLVGAVLFTFFNPRYLLYLAPLCYVLMAGAGAWAAPRGRPSALAIAGVTLALWLPVLAGYYQQTGHEDIRSLVRRIVREGRPGDAIVVNSGWRNTVVDYYLRESSSLARYVIPLEAPPDEQTIRRSLDEVGARHERVWEVFFGAEPTNATRAIGPLLSERFARVVDRNYGTTRLALYVRGRAGSEGGKPLALEDALQLVVGPLQWPREGQPLDSAVVSLDWRPLRPLNANYAASLRLIDEQGTIWGQADSAPNNGYIQTAGKGPGSAFRDHRGVLVPPGTPPGVYTATIMVYDASSGRALLPAGDAQAIGERSLVLGQIAVREGSRQPDLSGLSLMRRDYAVLGAEVALLGARWTPRQQAGSPIHVQLYWQALKAVDRDRQVVLRLWDPAGGLGGEVVAPITRVDHGGGPWTPGKVRLGRYRLPTDPRLVPGEYGIQLALVDGSSSNRPGAGITGSLTLGEVEVDERPPPPPGPAMQRSLGTVFGPGIALLGYSLVDEQPGANGLQPRGRPGDTVDVVLYWRWEPQSGNPQARLDRSYTAFIHVLDRQGKLVSQHDGVPGRGALPTTAWVGEEVMPDSHPVPLPPATAEGPFTFIAGLYDSETVQRLKTSDGADHVVLEGGTGAVK